MHVLVGLLYLLRWTHRFKPDPTSLLTLPTDKGLANYEALSELYTSYESHNFANWAGSWMHLAGSVVKLLPVLFLF